MTPAEMAALHAVCFTTPRPWSEQEFSELLDSRGAFVCARPGGFALGRAVAGEAELLTIAVHPGSRRQGIASALVEEFEHQGARLAAEVAFLEVSAENRAAIRLYQRAGYADVGRRAGYYRTPDDDGIDALVFRKSL